jgi:serine/threonine protein kinase
MIDETISHYKIVERLGGGGMGFVYKARDLKLDRFVALKFLPTDLSTNEKDKKRFIDEAKTTSALQHNNICTIHEVGETDDEQIFICMDYYDGETLKLKIEKGRLKITEVSDYAMQIAQGLQKAHEKGIIHRDIKPANIMILNDGTVKIVDFGLAKFLSGSKITQDGPTSGTINYMSPEQAAGEKLDFRSDIWALGAVMYEMLTGKSPFEGDYEPVVLYSIMNENPPSLTGMQKDMPEELVKIVNKCLQKDPDKRYRRIENLIANLGRLNHDSTQLSLSSNQMFFRNKSVRYNKKIWLPLGVIIIALMLVVGSFILNNMNQPEQVKSLGTIENVWANSIAVLPIIDLNPYKSREYISDIIVDHVINNLAKFQKLKVIALEPVMRYRNSNKSAQDIGNELNVQNILRGTVGIFGDRVRVEVQLKNTHDGSIIWSKKYNREYDNIFFLYEEIVRSISELLLDDLDVTKFAGEFTQKPKSVNVYEYYLKGRYYYSKFIATDSLKEYKNSERMFKMSIALDPDYALSYAGLAKLCLSYIGFCNSKDDSVKYMNLQKYYVEKALDLNPHSAEANMVQGYIYDHQGELDISYSYYRKAVELNPNSPECNGAFAEFLNCRGLLKPALRFSMKQIELHPISSGAHHLCAELNMFIGEYDKAETIIQKHLEFKPSSVIVWWNYLSLLIHVNKYEKAKKVIQNLDKLIKDDHLKMHLEALRYAIDGKKQMALSRIPKLTKNWTKVDIYHILGMYKEAIEPYLEQLSYKGDNIKSSQYYLLNITNNKELIKDPRFQKLIAEHKKLYETNFKKYGNLD